MRPARARRRHPMAEDVQEAPSWVDDALYGFRIGLGVGLVALAIGGVRFVLAAFSGRAARPTDNDMVPLAWYVASFALAGLLLGGFGHRYRKRWQRLLLGVPVGALCIVLMMWGVEPQMVASWGDLLPLGIYGAGLGLAAAIAWTSKRAAGAGDDPA